jgi:glycerol dehydrogenase-like iron-containing ADH family enzyme
LKQRIIANWSTIQNISTTVPSPDHILFLLEKAHSATSPGELGLSNEEVSLALTHAHYIRGNFTVMKLGQVLNLRMD